MNPQDEKNGEAIVAALATHAQSYQETAMYAVAHRIAGNSIDEESKDLYESALHEMPTSMTDLEDPLKYAAWCIRCMSHERKSRSKINMIMHIGKVFGHDKRTLEVKDVTSVRDIVRRFQQEFGKKAPIEAQVVVKQVDAGS